MQKLIKDTQWMIFLLMVFLVTVVIVDSWHLGRIEGEILQARKEISFVADQVEGMYSSIPPKYNYITFVLRTTAYSSEVSQCDSDPFVAAWDNPVGRGMVAVSRDLLKIGLTNRVPIVVDGKSLYIGDKMGRTRRAGNMRVAIRNSLDIWMETREKAVSYGCRTSVVHVPIEHIDLDQLFRRYRVRIDI